MKEEEKPADISTKRACGRWQYWLSLLPEEPFRLFFPLGIVVSLIGVSLWPLLYGGYLSYYPGVAHARMMMGGFVGAFALGFLGTALPRLMDAPCLRSWELSLVILAYLASVSAYGFGKTVIGDSFLLLTLLLFLVSMCLRLVKWRRDVPPPGFVLVALGWLSAMTALVLFLLEGDTPLAITGARYRFAQLLLYQGFILLPVLGTGAYMFPRFVGKKSRHEFEPSRTVPPGWMKKALISFSVGIFILGTFYLECLGHFKPAVLLRLIVVAGYTWTELQVFRSFPPGRTLAFGLQIGLLCILCAFAVAVFYPSYRVGIDHAIFASGFGVIALSVATRVILGHSGNSKQLGKRQWVLIFVIWTLVIAMTARVTSEFVPQIRVSHLNYAALGWAIGVLVWLFWIGKNILRQGK